MKGFEAHFTGRLGKAAEARSTRTRKPMVVLTVMVSDPGTDDAVWCTVLAFENLAEWPPSQRSDSCLSSTSHSTPARGGFSYRP